MSVIVESVSTAAMADSTSISIDKPTGLAVGDLMIAVVAGNDGGSTISIPTGWTSLLNNNTTTNGFGWYRAAYKVADSSDVAASNFTFTNGDGGVIYRLTGYATPSLITTGTGTPNSPDNHLILFNIAADNGGRTVTFSGYSVTGGTSVTFTERYDDANTTGIRVSLGVADGQYASGSAITAFSATVSGGVDDDNDFLIIVPALVNATGTTALLEPTTTLFSEASVEVGGTGTYTLLEPATTFFTETSRGTQPTVWTNESEDSTTWTNESEL